MLGKKIDALNSLCKTNRSTNRWFLMPAHFWVAGFLLCAQSCVMTSEFKIFSTKVEDLESEMAKMQRVRHDMEILLSGQKKTIDRLAQLEKQLSALRESLVDGHTKSTELTAEIQGLRNELEEAQYRYKLLEADQKDLAKNQQALKEEHKKRAPKNKAEHFALAKKNFSEEKFEDAISLFEQYVQNYPADNELPQAYYLLAESCQKRAQKEEVPEEALRFYKKAIIAYQEIVEKYGQSGLREEALFKMGLVLKSMGNKDAATAAFKEVISKHKGSKRAVEAKAQLSELEKLK